jgi:hypothetical protein
MPRAKAFTRSDVKARAQVTLDPDLIRKIEKNLEHAGIKPPKLNRVACEIEQAIRTHKLRICADDQERPARIVAILKPGLRLTKERRQQWLDKLPQSLRLDLGVPGPEGLTARIKKRLDYWQAKVRPQRPFGKGQARLDLRQTLLDFLAGHIDNEHKRRQPVADILTEAGVKFPNEKKNRGKFTGIRRQD